MIPSGASAERWARVVFEPCGLLAGLAACHCLKCHCSFADRPAYDAHRRLARPCLHPVVLGVELLGERGWGWAARDTA